MRKSGTAKEADLNFQSFFMAGFECATGYNSGRRWIDQIQATEHDKRLGSDYAMVKEVGIRTVREGIRWPLVDKGGPFDLSEVRRVVDAANRHRVELILDLFHYGFPSHLDIYSEAFADRFADYCQAVASEVAKRADVPVHFTPVNEPSYFAWAAGEAARFAPYDTGRAYEMKVSMVRAAIRGIEAIWSLLPAARMVNVDPVCKVAPPVADRSRDDDVRFFNEVAVFECWDMLAGKLHPELGGSPKHLDIVGINYYWTNQWEIDRTGEPLAMDDARLTPVRDLIRKVWERYRRPMIISETSHVEHMRGPWLRYVVEEVEAARAEDIPLNGICIYPVLGMPEWHEPEVWVRMGMWDCVPNASGRLQRIPDPVVFEEYFDAVRRFGEIESTRQKPRAVRR
jgi:beta-glucosidase/6-phospho-beta-glucosidase/beta-galactosidase